MDISYTLIVALMFITILSFGFANILSSLAEIVNKKNQIHVTHESRVAGCPDCYQPIMVVRYFFVCRTRPDTGLLHDEDSCALRGEG